MSRPDWIKLAEMHEKEAAEVAKDVINRYGGTPDQVLSPEFTQARTLALLCREMAAKSDTPSDSQGGSGGATKI